MTHGERVLAALRTGPKSASYLYSLGLIAHSRVASLRAQGHIITCVKTGNRGAQSYIYTLVEAAPSEPVGEAGLPLATVTEARDSRGGTRPEATDTTSGSLGADSLHAELCSAPEQLSLVA